MKLNTFQRSHQVWILIQAINWTLLFIFFKGAVCRNKWHLAVRVQIATEYLEAGARLAEKATVVFFESLHNIFWIIDDGWVATASYRQVCFRWPPGASSGLQVLQVASRCFRWPPCASDGLQVCFRWPQAHTILRSAFCTNENRIINIFDFCQ